MPVFLMAGGVGDFADVSDSRFVALPDSHYAVAVKGVIKLTSIVIALWYYEMEVSGL